MGIVLFFEETPVMHILMGVIMKYFVCGVQMLISNLCLMNTVLLCMCAHT